MPIFAILSNSASAAASLSGVNQARSQEFLLGGAISEEAMTFFLEKRIFSKKNFSLF